MPHCILWHIIIIFVWSVIVYEFLSLFIFIICEIEKGLHESLLKLLAFLLILANLLIHKHDWLCDCCLPWHFSLLSYNCMILMNHHHTQTFFQFSQSLTFNLTSCCLLLKAIFFLDFMMEDNIFIGQK